MYNLCYKYINYCNFSFIYDRENILKLKDTYDVVLKVKQDKNMKKGKYKIKISDVYTDFYEEHSKKKN